jgi:hypothetical protein
MIAEYFILLQSHIAPSISDVETHQRPARSFIQWIERKQSMRSCYTSVNI